MTIRVLHLISSSGFFGAERVVVELATASARAGRVAPVVGSINNRYNPHREIRDMLVPMRIPCVEFPCASRFDARLLFRLRRYINSNEVHIVHAHGYKANFYAYLATRLSPVAAVATVHNWILTDDALRRYAAVDKFLLRGFDAVAVVSPALKDEVRAAGIPESRIWYIANGIGGTGAVTDAQAAAARRALGLPSSAKVVGTVGRLSDEKGHRYFIEAALGVARRDPAVRFLIVGDGPARNALTGRVSAEGYSDRFLFTGVRQDVPLCLAAMDIFVLPSLMEGMPMALLEAMAAGVPVIATAVGAVPAIINDTVNGRLVPPGHTAALEACLTSVLADPAGARRMAENAAATVREHYSSDAMALAYDSLYAAQQCGRK